MLVVFDDDGCGRWRAGAGGLTVFPASKLAPLLRAVVDPEGKGEMPAGWLRAIDRIERNVNHAGFADTSLHVVDGDAP
jgi:hypothetical protein